MPNVYYCPGRRGFRRRGGGGVQFSKRLDFGGSIFKKAQNVRGVEILRHRTGLLCKRCQTILRLKQIHVSFKRRQKKNTLWRFFFIDKMLPVSLTQEPFSYCSYQECSVHVRTYAYAYSRNLEKMYRFF